MKKPLVLLMAMAILGLLAAFVRAQPNVPAKWFRPDHRSAHPQTKACLPGYSRLFGRNPPTCYKDCPRGWSVYSNVTAGAKCVYCPPNYYVTSHPNGSYSCSRSTGQRVFGQ